MEKWEYSMEIEFQGVGENEAYARGMVAMFVTPLNPTLEELADIKVAVSEAVTNAVIHGYEEQGGNILLKGFIDQHVCRLEIIDYGKGIEDISRAMEPLYTSKPGEERSGMGFSFMEAFTDAIYVESTLGKGTKVTLIKKMGVAMHGQDN